MLIDTGASHTFVDESALAPLGLDPHDSVPYQSASPTASDRCNVYDIALTIGSAAERNQFTLDPLRIHATPYLHQRHQGLLGRDVLSRVQFAWNGPAQTIELLYP
jgi:hypothetical protein